MRSTGCKHWSRRAFVASVGAAGFAGTASAPLVIGGRKQLLLDEALIESRRGVTMTPNPPYLPRENLLPQSQPWEQVRAGAYASMAHWDGRYHLWYTAYPGAGSVSEEIGPRFDCYATSANGVRWTKLRSG